MDRDRPKTLSADRQHLQPLVIIAVALTVVIGCFLLFTSPEQIGPGGVTAFFILGYCLSLCLLELFYRLPAVRKKKDAFWLRAYYAALPIILFGLSSLRQLSIVDIVVIAVLTVAITTYHKRRAESPFNLI